jgi:hypothetical protein
MTAMEIRVTKRLRLSSLMTIVPMLSVTPKSNEAVQKPQPLWQTSSRLGERRRTGSEISVDRLAIPCV